MGHSSLHTVKRAQVDILKIDRSFVAGLGRDIQDGAICKAMISLGAELGIQVIAEGIETELQLERLQELGCELGQGFHLARPAAAADVDFDGRLLPASKEA